MEIVLNGSPRQLNDNATLNVLVTELQLGQQAIAIAVNRQVIARQSWGSYQLQAMDSVDVVRAIGGG